MLNRLVAAGWKGEGNKLHLPHDMICSITEARDLVLRLSIEKLRQKAGYFVDADANADRLVVIKLNTETSNRVRTEVLPNAHKITNRVTMLGHISQIT